MDAETIYQEYKSGIVTAYIDVLAQSDKLYEPYVGGKKFLDQIELASWIGGTYDPAVWQRCLQVDFNRSTVIGVALGERPAGTSVFVESVKYLSKDHRVIVKVVEVVPTAPPEPNDLGVVKQICYPFQIVKFLSCGTAEVTYTYERRTA